jgi:hemoglobin/transferrin/lactoferrin receptor protein
MARFICLFFLFSVLAVQQVAAQLVRVVNGLGQPLEGVVVSCKGTEGKALSDGQGQVSLNLFAGCDSLLFRHVAFMPLQLASASIGHTVRMEDHVVGLQEIVLSASKWEQEKRFTAHQVAVVQAWDVHYQQPPTTADLLGNTGQVFIQKSQMGGGSPMIRGFAANSVLIVVDGIRMNNAIFRSGNLHNVLAVDAQMLDRAEVIFGPGSVLYGSDAMGGTMAFHTREPAMHQQPGRKVVVSGDGMMRYASANQEKTGHVSLNIAGKKWGLLSGITFSDFDDLRMGSIRPDRFPDFGLRREYVAQINGRDSIVANPNPGIQRFSGYSQWNITHKLVYKPLSKLEVSLLSTLSTTSAVPRYDRLTEYRNGQLRQATWNYHPQNWSLHALKLHYHAAQFWADVATLTVAFQHMEEGREERRVFSPLLLSRADAVDVWSLQLDAQKKFPRTGTTISYGVELTDHQVASSGEQVHLETGISIPIAPRYPAGGSTMRTAAAYMQVQQPLSARWSVQAGGRYNLVGLDAQFGPEPFYDFPFNGFSQATNALNGQLGLVWLPGKNWQWYLQTGSSFRAPNVDDAAKIFDSQPGAVVVPNPDLRPETTWNVELGTRGNLGNQLTWEVAAYYTWLFDVMVRRDFQFEGADSLLYDGTMSRVQAIVNAGRGYVWGVSSLLKWDFHSNWSVSTTLNHTRGHDLTFNQPLRHVPPFFGDQVIRYKKGRWNAAFLVRFNGWKRNARIPDEELAKVNFYTEAGSPGWYTLNLQTACRVSDKLSAHVHLENLLDHHYRPYSSGISAPGRNLVLALRGSF